MGQVIVFNQAGTSKTAVKVHDARCSVVKQRTAKYIRGYTVEPYDAGEVEDLTERGWDINYCPCTKKEAP